MKSETLEVFGMQLLEIWCWIIWKRETKKRLEHKKLTASKTKNYKEGGSFGMSPNIT